MNVTVLFRICCIVVFFMVSIVKAQVPTVYSNIKTDSDGKLYLEVDGKKAYAIDYKPAYTLSQMLNAPKGTRNGVYFDFNDKNLTGLLYVGLIHYNDSRHPYPVFYNTPLKLIEGKCFLDIKNTFSNAYDMTGWQKAGRGTIGYRLANQQGELLYDGMVSFIADKNFAIDTTIIEGPMVNMLTSQGCVISFNTNIACVASVEAGGKRFSDNKPTTQHEILVNGLNPDTEYKYSVLYGSNQQSYSFRTAPADGTRTAFTFAYASDSRAGQGGGERNLFGTNFYIVKKIMALATQQKSRFMQFTGDLITGYGVNADEQMLEYANWKRAVQPYTHYFPAVAGMGNHEILNFIFRDDVGNDYYVEKFPFETEGAEVIFAQNVVNPHNTELLSEDGSALDPSKKKINFPPYDETVFYYTYDNVAMVVLNSNYWYAPTLSTSSSTSGNLHGYIMDNQLAWLEKTIATLEANPNIDHIFVTQHTPAFPNGGHVKDDMWYSGNNKYRPYIAGVPVEKGIIERRDQYLDILINKSTKVVAMLTGDEHNYCRTEISPQTDIYPPDYDKPKLQISRTIWQINNGAAGAPYYAQEQTPWTPFVKGFTTQHALVLFDVKGKSIQMRTLNPDTLEDIDQMTLR